MATSTESSERSEGFETKRMDILRQAALVFAADGYHQTSVGSLAERIGVSKPVLYYYAKNKDDLLYQCCLVARDELNAAIADTNRTQLSGIGKIRRFFSTYARIMGSDFGRCYVLVDVRALGPGTREKETAGRRGLEEAVRRMIVEGHGDGSIRPCDPTLTARVLFGAFNGIPRWFHSDGELKVEDVADAYVDVFMIGIARAGG